MNRSSLNLRLQKLLLWNWIQLHLDLDIWVVTIHPTLLRLFVRPTLLFQWIIQSLWFNWYFCRIFSFVLALEIFWFLRQLLERLKPLAKSKIRFFVEGRHGTWNLIRFGAVLVGHRTKGTNLDLNFIVLANNFGAEWSEEYHLTCMSGSSSCSDCCSCSYLAWFRYAQYSF